jgi:hypothetical protein
LGGSDVVEGTLGNGGELKGVGALVAADYPGVTLEATHTPASGLGEALSLLDSIPSDGGPDIVYLSLASEVSRFDGGQPADDLIAAIDGDLVALIQGIKEKLGAHILVANLSTYDPGEPPVSYAGLAAEPFVLRAHRLDMLAVEVSHREGVSIVDVDRLLAELGADGTVTGPAEYGPAAQAVIASEVVRILADYGFFDDRPLMAQVGAGGAQAS